MPLLLKHTLWSCGRQRPFPPQVTLGTRNEKKEKIKIQKKDFTGDRQWLPSVHFHLIQLLSPLECPVPIPPPPPLWPLWALLSNEFALGYVENESLWALRDKSNIREWLETKRPDRRHVTVISWGWLTDTCSHFLGFRVKVIEVDGQCPPLS